MLTSGKVGYEVGANVDATSFGGIAAVHRLGTRIGLVEEIDQRLELLKVHLPYHESDHVLNMSTRTDPGADRARRPSPRPWRPSGRSSCLAVIVSPLRIETYKRAHLLQDVTIDTNLKNVIQYGEC